MNAHRMTLVQLVTGNRAALRLAVELQADQPEVAALLLDAAELARAEIAVHVCGGDRERAARLHRGLESATGSSDDA